MTRTITSEELRALLDKRNDVTILDVRRRTDHDADPVAISAAEWRDPDTVAEWIKELPKDKEVVIYCARGGSVSNAVLDQLQKKSIPARYLEGGIAAWKAAGGKTSAKISPL